MTSITLTPSTNSHSGVSRRLSSGGAEGEERTRAPLAETVGHDADEGQPPTVRRDETARPDPDQLRRTSGTRVDHVAGLEIFDGDVALHRLDWRPAGEGRESGFEKWRGGSGVLADIERPVGAERGDFIAAHRRGRRAFGFGGGLSHAKPFVGPAQRCRGRHAPARADGYCAMFCGICQNIRPERCALRANLG